MNSRSDTKYIYVSSTKSTVEALRKRRRRGTLRLKNKNYLVSSSFDFIIPISMFPIRFFSMKNSASSFVGKCFWLISENDLAI